MKKNRILSTAGICRNSSIKLRSYCNLMQASLANKWLFADDFVDSHVCFIGDGYLQNMDKNTLDKSQVIVVINASNTRNIEYPYQISLPLTATKIRNVLNHISENVDFKPLNLIDSKPKATVNKFKSAFSKIRTSFFGKRKRKTQEAQLQSRKQFVARITKTINIGELTPYKIILMGSPGSGKTTAIQTISEGKSLNSDVSATDSVASKKAKTTVGIDYAEIKFMSDKSSKERKIKLIGTPGQIKYNFIWDMVGKNADAFVVLLDMSRPEPLSYLKFYKKFLQEELGKVTQVYCALTHTDYYEGHITHFIDCIESEFPILKGVYKIDARKKQDISNMLADICPQIEYEKEYEEEYENKQIANKQPTLSLLKGMRIS